MRLPTILTLLLSILYSSLAGATDPVLEFLNALNDGQKEKVQYAFDDATRETWHFFPASMYSRPGIAIGELDEHQRALFHVVLRHSLSAAGYDKTQRIIGLEKVLAELEGNPEFRDPGKYFIAFYGDPQTDDPWGWSLEGHHLSLNFTIVGKEVSMTPRFLGANPATVPSGPQKGDRILAAEEDLGFQLVNALAPEQRTRAIFQDHAPDDIVTANASEVSALDAMGIPAGELTPDQKDILTDLLVVYLSFMPGDLALERMQQLRSEDFDAIRFAWAGALAPGKPHYYRVQGRSFLIEFDNIQDNANHIHTVWRDFDGDFGRDLLREHYEREH